MAAAKLIDTLTVEQEKQIRAGTVKVKVTPTGTVMATKEGRSATARTARQAIELLGR